MTEQTLGNAPSFFARLRNLRLQEEEQAKSNPFLARAILNEKNESHRLAVIARTIAFIVIAITLPIVNSRIDVLYYEAIVVLFIAIGWLQLRMSTVGQSGAELLLILLDVVLLTFVCVVPNPFLQEEIPSAFIYRFDTFSYFFILLALGTLAYSWRTVWAIGTWVAGLWVVSLIGVMWFGYKIPGLSEAAANAFEGHNIISSEMDPNGARAHVRIQEVVIFLITAAILAVKGWRSNRLMVQQAEVAAERANLSRYFPTSLVDTLASTDHDIGAVRNQSVGVLFSDIVGFTEFAEKHQPEVVMEFLRSYHAFIEAAIFHNGGTLDKFLGDGVMATFGTPTTSDSDASNALGAALEIINGVEALNAQRRADGQEEMNVSVGVHYGPVILGDIGPARRLEFAVIGDTVNVSSRLEAASRDLNCRCVVSDDLMKKAQPETDIDRQKLQPFKQLKGLKLRGRQSGIDVWTM